VDNSLNQHVIPPVQMIWRDVVVVDGESMLSRKEARDSDLPSPGVPIFGMQGGLGTHRAFHQARAKTQRLKELSIFLRFTLISAGYL
jgi:hypothetical protein